MPLAIPLDAEEQECLKMNTQASVPVVHQLSLFSWPLLMVRGIAALLFVLSALLAFDKTMTLLVWFFAVYVFFDGAYSFVGLVSAQDGGALHRVLIGCKSIVGVAAGVAVILLAQRGHTLVPMLFTVFAWVAIVGVLEGVWVIRSVRNKEMVLIIGSSAYLALALALQFIFALAPNAGSAVYNWIIIGFSAAFAAAMFGMSWSLRLQQRRQMDTVSRSVSHARS